MAEEEEGSTFFCTDEISIHQTHEAIIVPMEEPFNMDCIEEVLIEQYIGTNM